MDQQDRRPTAPFVLRAAQSRFRLVTAGILAATLATMPAAGQTAIRIDEPAAGRASWLIKNYQPRTVPPINLANTSRLDALIKAGNLYLTAQDVVSLVLENNIDIEVNVGPRRKGDIESSVLANVSPYMRNLYYMEELLKV